MRFLGALLVIWLLIGGVAAWQRGYFSGAPDNCAEAGTVLVTIVAGPLNYMGVNPQISCELPQPSQ
ncbi:hypothetical protein ACJJV6_04880 [Arthrobacter nitrophenolicus]|jgi:hypothetical protein|uniref:Uncharacterized protein n=1 Tax=Arthrobacter nitrophenolicus TaxID=683150 RepID=L8TRQ3_9MICC|nr:hypothetical protein [Arthrobacter nitrophenolicus]ELT43939.1 hypothetical protein G205_14875 [Arthrobacter nitrophenolicus]TDL38942.1 hypothetical protein E2R57_08445 [Arthrobacter nitrophenolicus]